MGQAKARCGYRPESVELNSSREVDSWTYRYARFSFSCNSLTVFSFMMRGRSERSVKDLSGLYKGEVVGHSCRF